MGRLKTVHQTQHASSLELNFFEGPSGGAYSAPPDPLAGFKGPTSKGREGRKRREGWEGGGRRRGGERGEDVEGPRKWSAPGPVLALGGPGLTQMLTLSL